MATTIKLKNSVTTTAAPSTLVQGEAAVNITDKKVWVGDATSTPVQIIGAGAPVSGTTGTFTGNVSVAGTFSANGGATLGDASGDALTINSNAVSIPNGLNFDSNTFVIDATNNRVGVGTASPLYKLQITTATSNWGWLATDGTREIGTYIDSSGGWLGTRSNDNLLFMTNNGGAQLVLATSGSLGLGATPSSWTGGLASAFQVKTGSIASSGAGDVRMYANTYYDGSYRYIGSSFASYYQQASGQHIFAYTSSGTAGNAITWSEAMRINSSGNVGIGTSSPSGRLSVTTSTMTNQIIADSMSDSTTYGLVSLNGSRVSTGYLGIAGGGGTDTTMFLNVPSGGAFSFRNAFTERMRLDSSGNLGLGVTPSAWSVYKAFDIGRGALVNASTETDLVHNAYWNGTNWIYKATDFATHLLQINGQYRFYTAPSGTAGNAITFTQAMTLDASGNLLLGTSSNNTGLSASPKQIIYGSTITDGSGAYPTTLSIIDDRAYNSTSPSAGGGICFGYKYTSGGAIALGPSIQGFKENTTDSNYASGLSFLTRAQGSNPTERMRIDSSGNLLVGTTSGSTQLYVNASGTTGKVASTFQVTNNTVAVSFNVAGTQYGYINVATTGTTYSTSSDYRLKEDVQPMVGALDKITQLKPVTYKWKVDGSDGQGFIAHELAEVVPDCVTGEKDAVDADGNPVYQGIDTSFLVATLTAAIQELKAEVDSLKAQLNK